MVGGEEHLAFCWSGSYCNEIGVNVFRLGQVQPRVRTQEMVLFRETCKRAQKLIQLGPHISDKPAAAEWRHVRLPEHSIMTSRNVQSNNFIVLGRSRIQTPSPRRLHFKSHKLVQFLPAFSPRLLTALHTASPLFNISPTARALLRRQYLLSVNDLPRLTTPPASNACEFGKLDYTANRAPEDPRRCDCDNPPPR
jgi:hypothetical protein